MGSLRNPVGSLAPAVYWRRRVLVLLAVLAVLALLLYACSGSGSGKKQPVADGKSTASPTSSQSSTPGSTASSSAGANGGVSGASSGGPSSSAGVPSGGVSGGSTTASGGPGNPGTGPNGGTSGPGCHLDISLSTPAAAYANGDNPQFTAVLKNTGSSDCDVDLSPKSLVLDIYSGADHIWSSADCFTGPKEPFGIAPGGSKPVSFTWNRTRSAQGCPANAVAAQLGTYRGVVTLGTGSGANAPVAQSGSQPFELKTGS